MNSHAKTLHVTHFILALIFLFASLHFLSSALTYDKRQSFAPPILKYDPVENEYLVMNMKMPLLFLFTGLFGLGWWCESVSENLVLKNKRKLALVIFYTPFIILIACSIGMTQFPIGFINSALMACGWVVVSSFYLRYTLITPEVQVKFSEPK